MASNEIREHGSVGKVCASCFGLAAFAVAVIAGMMNDNPSGTVLYRAILAMLLCYVIGALLGMIVQRVTSTAISRDRTGGSEDQTSVAEATTRSDEGVIVV